MKIPCWSTRCTPLPSENGFSSFLINKIYCVIYDGFFILYRFSPEKIKPNQPTNRRANETRSVNGLSTLPSHASFLFSCFLSSIMPLHRATEIRMKKKKLKSQNVCVDVITQQQKRLTLEKGHQERKSEKKEKK